MVFLDKLRFWKKKDEFEFGTDAGKDKLGLHPETGLAPSFEQTQYPSGFGDFDAGMGTQAQASEQNYGQQQSQQYPQYGQKYGQQYPAQQTAQQPRYAYASEQVVQPAGSGTLHEKNMELISLKLDSLRTSIDSVNQRLVNIEQMLRSRRSW